MADRVGGADFTIENLVVRFGGLVAVESLSLSVGIGEAVGLIGPNGAGKTTTFNACSGLVRPSSGVISLRGEDISRKSPSARARLGLGRTFQRMELYDRLSVRENVAMGLEARLAGRRLLGSVLSTRAEQRAIVSACEDALTRCGIMPLAERRAGVLPSGQRRLVELARALASGFDIMLLDEPSSGLDATETTDFAMILRNVIADGKRGILLVEHDMSLVRAVCDYTYVLDFGRLIHHGATEEVLDSEVVRAAYLGEERVA